MGKVKLKGRDLRKINYSSNHIISLAIDLISKHYKHSTQEENINLLKDVKENYENYLEHEFLGKLAESLKPESEFKSKKQIELLKEEGAFQVFGRKHISSNAYQQMAMAMRLPIAEKGALMPDAHFGYGLPIGGVLATKNAVIPYGVGLDIGCRMALTVFDAKVSYLDRYTYQIKMALKEKTNFGTGGVLDIPQEHEILDRPEFNLTPLLKQLHGKAARQLGTSGSGNHFVEFGVVEMEKGNDWGLDEGQYLGLLSHSGSRGLGASIAQHYTDLAMQECLLPGAAKNLAWLDLDTEAGQEYWVSMNLAGDYAKACHDQIHSNLSRELGLHAVGKIENHHNFAWKEKQANGEELVVHRKGATPAKKGELGIIPGSMATSAYIVSGKGEAGALNSASHGAGRKMSRKATKESYTGSELKKVLKREGVTLIGGGVDEAPIAYKDIHEVIASQTNLVDVIGTFHPKIVRMDKK